jgi:Ras-related protein Rab-2A
MYSHLFKYIIVGESGCGKSSLLLQFIDRRFTPSHDITIGIEFGAKIIKIKDPKKVKLQIWDTAGHESFHSITRSYYRGAAVAIIVYDITNRHTFTNTIKWLDDIKEINNDNTLIVIVGNKADLIYRRMVTEDEGQELADKYGCLFYECSAKTSQNVNQIFEDTAKIVYTKIETNTSIEKHRGVKVNSNHETEKDCIFSWLKGGCVIL